MARFEGYLYSKLGGIGSRSEGPVYFLQQWDYSEVPVVKRARPWQGDSSLHRLLASKVRIEGIRSPEGIQYESVTPLSSEPVGRPTAAPRPGLTSPTAGLITLKQGSFGSDVRRLQERLRSQGYEIPADGYFGNPTVGAVKRFQAEHGLTANGIVGPETWHSLG